MTILINQENLLNKLTGITSQTINDLREKDFSGRALTLEEKKALSNFDSFRLNILNNLDSEELFHKEYIKFQALANLTPYQEFLKEEYSLN